MTTERVGSERIVNLKHAMKTLWQMENELRVSAWNAMASNKEKAEYHLAEARRHFTALLHEADPVPQMVDPTPGLDGSGSNGANT